MGAVGPLKPTDFAGPCPALRPKRNFEIHVSALGSFLDAFGWL